MNRKYDIIDALDKGEDGLNEIQNSMKTITLLTTRNLGIALSGEIPVEDDLKTKFSTLSAKLEATGSSTTEINTIVTNLTKDLGPDTDPDSIGYKIKDLVDKNNTLRIDDGLLVTAKGGGALTSLDSTRLLGADRGIISTLTPNERKAIIDAKRTMISHEISQNSAEIRNLSSQKSNLLTNESNRKNIQSKYRERRYNEMKARSDGINSFNTAANIPNITINFSNRAISTNPKAKVDEAFNTNHGTGVDNNIKYEICDKNKNVLTKVGDDYIYSTNPSIKLKNIKFDENTGTYDFTNLEIDSDTATSQLDLSVTAKKEANGLKFSLNKPLTVNLLMVDQGKRRDAFDIANTGDALKSRLELHGKNQHRDLENKVFQELFEQNGQFGSMTLSEQQKKELFASLHKAVAGEARYENALTANKLGDATAFGFFKDRFTHNDHESNKPPHNKSETNYRSYISTNYIAQAELRMKKKLKKEFEDPAHITLLQNALDQYIQNLQTNEFSDSMKSLHTATLPTITKDTRHRLKKALFPKPDINYMRYLISPTPQEIKGQEFSLNNTKVKYDMKVAIPNMHTISAEVIMGDKTFNFSGKEPSAIIDAMLHDPQITEDRTKLHLCYTFIKAVTKKAQEKHLPLVYEDAGVIKSLKVEGTDNGILTLSEDGKKVFNETDFTTSQNRDALEGGVEKVLNHFYEVMGKTNTEEKKIVEKREFDTRIAPGSLALRTKFINLGKNLNFDFGPLSKTIDGKQVSITFSKNVWTVNMDGQTFENTNLFDILYSKKTRKLFEGKDKDILARGNKKLIEQACKNPKVSRYPLAVEDPISQELYLLENGKFYAIPAANKARSGQFSYDYPAEMITHKGVKMGVIKDKDTITNGQKGQPLSDEAIDSLLRRSKLSQNFFTLISDRLSSIK